MSDIEKRFPFDAYPKGWFQVAYSREVDPGQVVGLHYFGRRLICYRGDSGNPYVLDAYCPHLGADIAVGGAVADDCISLPVPWLALRRRRIECRDPVREDCATAPRGCGHGRRSSAQARSSSGTREASTEPEWELPKIPESEDAAFTFHAPESARWRFRSHPQEVFENTVDIAHFATVHGVSGFGDLDLETDGHRLRAVAEVTFQTPRGPVSGAVDSELFGMGLDVVRHRGLGRSCTLLTVTPIDGEFVDAGTHSSCRPTRRPVR